MRKRKVLSLFLSLALVLTMVVGIGSNVSFAEEEGKTLTIIHTNDVHGRFEYEEADGREPSIGYAKLKTYLDEKRAEGNVLLLDAGDVLHGTLDANLSEGKLMIDLMNLMEVDAMVPGNHDFNYGHKRLLELKGLAGFPMLAANVKYEENGENLFDAYTIKEYDGFKVGIFGLATEETKIKSHPDNTKGIEFTDYIQAAKDSVAALQAEEVDLIIALAHIGDAGGSDVTTIDIAEAVEGIDIIVDGHSHSKLEEGNLVGETLIVQTGEYMANLGLVEIKIQDGKVVEKTASLFTVEEAAELADDDQVEPIIAEILEINEEVKKQVIGVSTAPLVGERQDVRTGETNLGNLISDAMVHAIGSDIAFTNGGGIRASIEAGEVTLEDAMTAFPFLNKISSINVTGQELMAALEHGVKDYPEQSGGFPHVSGMKYEFDQSKEAGQRVTKVMIGQEELDLEKTYVMATNDFIAVGGDGYTMFEGKTILSEVGLYSDALIAYFQEYGELEPEIEGRIVVVGDPVEIEEEEETEEEAREEAIEVRKYVVVADDVLWKIARMYDTTWEALAEYNNLKNPHLIFPNQVILIP